MAVGRPSFPAPTREGPMPRFLPKPAYTVGEITRILNAYEEDGWSQLPRAVRAVTQRKLWNNKRTRTFLRSRRVFPQGNGERCTAFVTYDQLKGLAPDVVDSMMDLDSLRDASEAA